MQNKQNIIQKLTVILLVCSFFFQGIDAQDDQPVTTRDRIFFGGNIGLMFGTVTSIEIAPIAGYRITPRWLAGAGLKYEYHKSNYIYNTYGTSIFGANAFTEFTLLKNFPSNGLSIIGHGEYEALSLEKKYFQPPVPNNETGRFIMNNILLGGGLRQYLGGRSSMYLLFLFNVNQAEISPYINPIIRIGFMF